MFLCIHKVYFVWVKEKQQIIKLPGFFFYDLFYLFNLFYLFVLKIALIRHYYERSNLKNTDHFFSFYLLFDFMFWAQYVST